MLQNLNTLSQLGPLKDKRALVRVDYNVPMSNGIISDATRIEDSIATIKHLQTQGAIILLMSHFGRPKGCIMPEYSLRHIQEPLSDILKSDIQFLEHCHGKEAQSRISSACSGTIFLMENTRFETGETKNDPNLAKAIAELADVYVADAFSVTHRAHASTYGVAQALPSYAGLALERELNALESTMNQAKRPLMAVVGGAKISSKIGILEHLIEKVDYLFIGGGMANTFLMTQGYQMGKSLTESDYVPTAKEILKKSEKLSCQIVLPSDAVLATQFAKDADYRVGTIDEIAPNEMALDIGPQSVNVFNDILTKTKTVLWNGPMGAFELPPFDQGTIGAATAVAKACAAQNCVAIAGGGDTVAALNHAGVSDQFDHISTAGGAFLEWLEGKTLPGISVLMKT